MEKELTEEILGDGKKLGKKVKTRQEKKVQNSLISFLVSSTNIAKLLRNRLLKSHNFSHARISIRYIFFLSPYSPSFPKIFKFRRFLPHRCPRAQQALGLL